MYDHIGLKVKDVAAGVRFYEAALAPLPEVLDDLLGFSGRIFETSRSRPFSFSALLIWSCAPGGRSAAKLSPWAHRGAAGTRLPDRVNGAFLEE